MTDKLLNVRYETDEHRNVAQQTGRAAVRALYFVPEDQRSRYTLLRALWDTADGLCGHGTVRKHFCGGRLLEEGGQQRAARQTYLVSSVALNRFSHNHDRRCPSWHYATQVTYDAQPYRTNRFIQQQPLI